MGTLRPTPGTLNALMEFDHVIRVNPDGSVDEPFELHIPEISDETVTPGWTLLDGYSGQYGYSGPIMHSSEYIGGGMARDILAEPGLYVALVAYGSHNDDSDESDDEDDNVIGWAVARKDDTESVE